MNSSTDGQKEDATVRSLEPYALLPTVFDVPALISFKSKIFSLTTTWDGMYVCTVYVCGYAVCDKNT